MADAAKGIECGMTAVMNLDRDALAKCCEEASVLGCVQICNYNCPGQLVIGGEKAAVEKAAELAKAAGARRCIPLKVSGPFHTKLMHPAGDALAKRFVSEHFGEMETPVLFNCLGHEKADSDSIPALLEKQVQSSVYMEDTLRRLGELGVTDILEVGPGKALSGFVKRRWAQMSTAPLSRRQKRWRLSSPAGRRHRHERRKADPCRRRHRRKPGHRPGCLCCAGKAGLQCGGQLLPR